MKHPFLQRNEYRTAPDREKTVHKLLLRSRIYYITRFLGIVLGYWPRARFGTFTPEDWYRSSRDVFNTLEDCGGQFDIRGLDHLAVTDSPAVIISNHMSTLETVTLPFIILPFRYAVFVVKEQLLKVPFFGIYTRSTGCIGVTRKSPSEDFKQVMRDGSEKLKNGQSVIIFPQATRDTVFRPENFNSLGIKLAKKAGVPVIPLALKTDFWGNGKLIKDFGPLDLKKKIHFEFGKPFDITGSGREEHQRVVAFIQTRLDKWK